MPLARVALWVSSLGGLALLGWAVWFEPPPLSVVVLALIGYLAFAVAGVLIPQLEMFGDVVWRGPRSRRAVALTFDDGPNPATTSQVLELLERAGAHATFFVIGEKVERHPEVVRAIVSAGHDIGVHGFRHDWLYSFKSPRAVTEDLARATAAVERASGVRVRWFRPPIGHVSPRTANGAQRAGLTVVAWTVRALDGLEAARPERVVRRVSRGLVPGAIVLLHDAAERDERVPASLLALPEILKALELRGLEAVRLDELAGRPERE
jgi:peptidoglycan/xylan/chitin deacetylase (PgdA/CDA1 family)